MITNISFYYVFNFINQHKSNIENNGVTKENKSEKSNTTALNIQISKLYWQHQHSR